jgi:Rrf2 family transcriptional regulator, iron-sulfur cluster assembly transcription factor
MGDVPRVTADMKKSNSVKLTTRGRHAIMAIIELARQSDGGPVPLSKIAEPGKISLSYLEQLFACLRRHGIVKSYRGPGGGYTLARPADDILVADILVAAERCVPAERVQGRQNDNPCIVQTDMLWNYIGEMLHACLKRVSLQDLIQDSAGAQKILRNKLFDALN